MTISNTDEKGDMLDDTGKSYSFPDDIDGLGQSEYDFRYRVFPPNLGDQSYNCNYMVININVQNGTYYNGSIVGSQGPIQTFNRFDDVSTGPYDSSSTGQLSKVDALRRNIDPLWTTSDGGSLGYDSLFLPRATRRIRESIALYMPNTVQFDTNNSYEDISLTGLGAGAVSTGMSALTNALSAEGTAGKAAGKLINQVTNAIGSTVSSVSKLAQAPINPRLEVLFSNTLQRTFQYDFLFAPETEQESIIIHQIIRTLRFHAAPELGYGTVLWVPPSEFDITFFNKGYETFGIPRINTCALTRISLDYAPSGIYSTFSSGYPVSVRMQLEFRELEVVHRLRVAQGF